MASKDNTALLPANERVIQRFKLTVTAGPDRGSSIVSQGAELSIGKDPGNDLVLSDTAVSRHHASIAIGPSGALLRDLGSTNGTELDSCRIEAAYVRAGSTIAVGGTTIIVQGVDDPIREPLSPLDSSGAMLGKSSEIRRIFSVIPKIAESDSTILIDGETGTGKGLLAETIHRASKRSTGPFVVVDCASIPATLMESELFGHEKGAFTGADALRIGAFEAACGGSIFLDEIGELPLEMQPKLLRALEERTIKRIGSVEHRPLDVRVIAATHRDLRREVNRQRFRADLFYRLNVVRLRIPPLRDRLEDVEILATHFHQQMTGGKDPPRDLLDTLLSNDWLGNTRELRTAVERAVLFGSIEIADALAGNKPEYETAGTSPPHADEPFRIAKEHAIAAWERRYLAALILKNGGNLSKAARAAKMDRNHLRDLLKKHGIAPKDSAEPESGAENEETEPLDQ